MKCGKRRSKTGDGTVRVCHDESFAKSATLALGFDQPDMLVVDLRNEKRNVIIHAIAGRITYHCKAGTRKRLFCFTCNARWQAREDDLTIERRLDRLHLDIANGRRNLTRELPCTCFGVRLPRRTVRRREGRYLKLRVAFKQAYKPLPDRSCRTQYSYSVLSHRGTTGLQNFLHSSNALGHSLFSVAERDPQEALRFAAERYARNGDDTVLQKLLRDLDIVADRAHIKHRVKRAFGRCGIETEFGLKEIDQKLTSFLVDRPRIGLRFLGLFGPTKQCCFLSDRGCA